MPPRSSAAVTSPETSKLPSLLYTPEPRSEANVELPPATPPSPFARFEAYYKGRNCFPCLPWTAVAERRTGRGACRKIEKAGGGELLSPPPLLPNAAAPICSCRCYVAEKIEEGRKVKLPPGRSFGRKSRRSYSVLARTSVPRVCPCCCCCFPSLPMTRNNEEGKVGKPHVAADAHTGEFRRSAEEEDGFTAEACPRRRRNRCCGSRSLLAARRTCTLVGATSRERENEGRRGNLTDRELPATALLPCVATERGMPPRSSAAVTSPETSKLPSLLYTPEPRSEANVELPPATPPSPFARFEAYYKGRNCFPCLPWTAVAERRTGRGACRKTEKAGGGELLSPPPLLPNAAAPIYSCRCYVAEKTEEGRKVKLPPGRSFVSVE
nr:hypothetical protein Iba_chr12aCG13400 [Ipomoea batatas]